MAYGQSTVRQEGGKRILVIDLRGAPYGADIALYEQAMRDVVDKLMEVDADEVVLSEYYERIYDAEQTRWLKEIADTVTRFEVDAVWSPSHIGKTTDSRLLAQRHDAVLTVLNTMHGDPFKAYLMLLREIKGEVAKMPSLGPEAQDDTKIYLNTLQYMREYFEKLSLIQKMKAYLSQLGEIPTGRTIYHSFFEVAIKPSFIGSRIFFTGAEGLELVDQYEVLGSKVYIYKHPDKVEYLYFINPPEYTLPPEKYFLLEKTKEVVAAHRPEHVEFMNIAQARKYFKKVYVATIADLALKNHIDLSVEEKEELATIVSRYTIGYGILELFLSDRQLTDVYIDSPLGEKPIYVVHSKYGQCQSNVIFSEEEARSVVSRFRALSGRPFDEAHPILDFDLQDLQTRIAVIGKPLALDGIAFALRLHKDTPWTLPQFVDAKMFDSFAAGLLSYYVDAQASMLIVGSRGSGKTSMLQSMMLEIPQNLRIIVQEDSVTGDAGILIERNGVMEFTTAGRLIDGLMEKYGYETHFGKDLLAFNPEFVKVFALDARNKIKLVPVTQFIRHAVTKPIYEIETRSGKRLKVTSDHSLFTLGPFGPTPARAGELKQGDFIATPRALRFPSSEPATEVKPVDVLFELSNLPSAFVCGPSLKNWLRQNRPVVNKSAKKRSYHLSTVQNWVRKGILPIPFFNELKPVLEGDVFFKIDDCSQPIPARLELDEDLACFAGLWLANGCYDGKYGVVISVDDEESRAVVRRVAEKLGLKTRFHSNGISLIISNTSFNWLMRNVLGLKGDSYTKKMPSWAYRVSENHRAALLRGLFSCDCTVSKNEVSIGLCSKQLVNDAENLLLSLGIHSRKSLKQREKDKTFRLRISSLMYRAFTRVGFLQEAKNERLRAFLTKKQTHDVADVIPLLSETKNFLAKEIRSFNKHDYATRGFEIGREKLSDYAAQANNGETRQFLLSLTQSDVYWDKIKSIAVVADEAVVYDFSVPGCENFVCENIVAHNTQEIPVPALKKLGFNIQRLKTRPPLGGIGETEVSAEDALRTALRLGDSVLIVGEVRSMEARALYEAMRIGAVGNVVMGTIHGESAYSIWDRVVNDLGVPSTSFKATDFAIVSAPIRFKGALKRFRRLIEVTEVRKHWNVDPDKEGGLLPWMSFDAGKDKLDFFEDVVLKNSEWLQRVKRVRGLTVEQIFDEVKARGETKQYLVDLSKKLEIPQLMEAEYSVRAHNKYVLMADSMRDEIGGVEYPELLKNWRSWVDQTLARDVQAVLSGKKPLA